eukprot:15467841-Alexandrium_andersonii.AAC.1
MEASFIADWEAERREYVNTAPRLPALCDATRSEAVRDCENLARELRLMKKRRASPPWSLPLELFCVAMSPFHRCKEAGSGAGL